MRATEATEAARRDLEICNACRYCEGYCAVFPAMERRLEFSDADLHYLANLCHNCGACYYACQYAPPHEFAVNVPQVLARIRADSYRRSAWPHVYGGWMQPLLMACLIGFLQASSPPAAPADFYSVISHGAMVGVFLTFGALALFLMLRSTGFSLWTRGLHDTLTLTNLGGARRVFHHFTFYGFLLCFASTTVAAIDHYVLGLTAPYPLLSAPVILGTFGGIGLLIGPAGQFLLKLRRDPAITDPQQSYTDNSLLFLLFAISLTGLLLLAYRGTEAMRWLLAIHLSVVLALFVLMPYGKFVHGLHRLAALARNAQEAAKRDR